MNKRNLILAMLAAGCVTASASPLDFDGGAVRVSLDGTAKTASYAHNGKDIISGAYVTAILADDTEIDSRSYPQVELSEKEIDDAFGKGKVYTYTYTGTQPVIEQNIYVYPDLDYFMVEVALTGENAAARQICPVVSRSTATLPLPASSNRIYDMPFANDNWATFNSHPWSLGQPVTSCEATALYNTDTRNAIVITRVRDNDRQHADITIRHELSGAQSLVA